MEEVEKIVKIPIDGIVVPKGRIRTFVRDKDFEETKASIADVGLIHPIEVAPNEVEGCYVLVEGERRLYACKELGWQTIPAIIRTRSELERERVEVEENLRRKDYTSTERHLALARLAKMLAATRKPELGRPKALTPGQVERAKQLREQGKSCSEIAEELGVASGDAVRQRLKEAEAAIQAPSVERAEKCRKTHCTMQQFSGAYTS